MWYPPEARNGVWYHIANFVIRRSLTLFKLQRNDYKPIQYILGRTIYKIEKTVTYKQSKKQMSDMPITWLDRVVAQSKKY